MPVMSIQFNGQKYWLEVRPGVGGVEQFKEDVRKLLGLHPDQAFDITFECRVPIPLAGRLLDVAAANNNIQGITWQQHVYPPIMKQLVEDASLHIAHNQMKPTAQTSLAVCVACYGPVSTVAWAQSLSVDAL